jgi:hypothetical protein
VLYNRMSRLAVARAERSTVSRAPLLNTVTGPPGAGEHGQLQRDEGVHGAKRQVGADRLERAEVERGEGAQVVQDQDPADARERAEVELQQRRRGRGGRADDQVPRHGGEAPQADARQRPVAGCAPIS